MSRVGVATINLRVSKMFSRFPVHVEGGLLQSLASFSLGPDNWSRIT
jgi:hypothetical protein